MAVQLAFIGLGNMGQAMSKNLVQKGNLEKPLILWNRTLSRATSLSENIGHSIVAESFQDAVSRSDIIFSCISDKQGVRAIIDTVLKGDLKGKLFVECSTVKPEYIDALVTDVRAAGAELVAMPVFGEPTMAEAGVILCVPAGKAEAVDRIKPYLIGVICKGIVDFSGEEPSKADLLKVVGNVFVINMIESLAEGHVLAEKTGLGVGKLQELLAAMFPGPYMIFSMKMSTGDYYGKEPLVSLDLIQHLADMTIDMAKESGTSLKTYETAVEHMKTVKSHAGPQGDITGLYGVVRMESGLQYENGKRKEI
ncbi:hypothetical protein N7G274_000587 [Stereocaulon virgatum]|uniref:6-phosphogluconate dehydrogenase NADP-binding domain-containing protein n=1 Tax=Stereocaulon virgatum TaxID=373712 RepID=A0ABR4ATT8_9LECA